jgi:hypothetical protein
MPQEFRLVAGAAVRPLACRRASALAPSEDDRVAGVVMTCRGLKVGASVKVGRFAYARESNC